MEKIINYFLEFSLSNKILPGIILGVLLFYVPLAFQSNKRQKNHKEIFALGLEKVSLKHSVFDIEKYILETGFIKSKSEWARQHNRAVENVKFKALIDHYDSDKYIIKRKGAWSGRERKGRS